MPVTGTPGGETPATLNLTLGAPASFAPFIPGIAKDYTTHDDRDAHVDRRGRHAVGRRPERDGHRTPGQRRVHPRRRRCRSRRPARTASARPRPRVGGSAAPTQLLTYDGPLGAEAATLKFKQSIGGTEALRTGGYAKTLTFTLSTTTP